jgi:hypothetical protein
VRGALRAKAMGATISHDSKVRCGRTVPHKRHPERTRRSSLFWLAPHFGVNGNGENLSVMIRPVSAAATLDAELHHATKELSQDRMIVNSHAEPTCHDLQAGWTLDARLPLPNGKVVSQVYHLTIVDGRAYAFIFTHAAGDRIDQAIVYSIQSICPTNKPAS